MTFTIDQKSIAVMVMGQHWPAIEALMGGTAAMRVGGEKFMPRQPREELEDYRYRLAVATLFPAFRRTVGVMAGKPFSKQISLGKNVPDEVAALMPNVDGQGRSLHAFASDLMTEVIAYGFGGVLVDYTQRQEAGRSRADDSAVGARPYWTHINHNNIIGWRSQTVGGITRLSQLRLAETSEVDDGLYGVKTVNLVRVLEPGRWALWQEGKDGYFLHSQGTTVLDVIPFVPFYGVRAGFMDGRAPLMDLAYQNIKHWQHQSDQDDSARFSRKRLLVFSGISDEGGDLTVAPNYAVKLPQGADAKVVQGSAESVAVGRSELDALEAQMIQAGAELLMAKPGIRTATEAANDAEANKSELQCIVETFEDSLDQCLQFTALWLNKTDGGNVSLFKDFSSASLSEATAQLLLSMQQGGIITKATVIRENQRRGILSPDLVVSDELLSAEAEGLAPKASG